MKILHVIRSMDPAGGGVAEAVLQMAAVHASQGHQVELLTLDSPDAEWLRTLPVPVHTIRGVIGRFGYSAALVPWLKKNNLRYDAVVANGIWQYPTFGLWRALGAANTPYFVFPHGMLDPWFKLQYPLKHIKKVLYWQLIERRVLRDAKAVFFTSEEEEINASKSFRLDECVGKVVPLGISDVPGDQELQKALFRGRFPETEGRRVILFLGRLHEKKGCDMLLRALAGLGTAMLEKLAFVIAGPCADEEYMVTLRSLAAEIDGAATVMFPGMLRGDLKWGAFRCADAFILPSHQENFGMAVAEALACGTPVLISNKVNIWREIEREGAGLVENDDHAGTRNLLERWLGLTDSERDDSRTAARLCYRRNFEIGQTARRMIETMEDCLRRGVRSEGDPAEMVSAGGPTRGDS